MEKKRLSVLERLANARKEYESNKGGFDSNEDIFCKIKTEGVHQLRLVEAVYFDPEDGHEERTEHVRFHSHFIGNGQYTKTSIYPDSAFQGEDKLRMSANCANFDPVTEEDKEGRCVICAIHAAANDMLKQNQRKRTLSDDDVKYLKDLAYVTAPKPRCVFLCIDRKNPEIAPGKNGFKIVEFPPKLFMQYSVLREDADMNLCSDQEAPDLKITVSGTGKDATYSINPVMKAGKYDSKPLTEEELGWERPDIFRIMCKMPKQKTLFDKLLEDIKSILPEDFDAEKMDQLIEKDAKAKAGKGKEAEETPEEEPEEKAEEKPVRRFGRAAAAAPKVKDDDAPKGNDEDDADVPF